MKFVTREMHFSTQGNSDIINLTHEDKNAHSHIRASLVGPSLCIPFENATLQLGKRQQIVFIDFDNRPRKRKIILQIIGEKS